VAASPGCKIWVIGNEMNFAMERPRVSGPGAGLGRPDRAGEPEPEPAPAPPELADPRYHGAPSRFNTLHPEAAARPRGTAAVQDGYEVITPDLYTRCFRLCRNAIRAQAGHGDDQVLVGGVAPWNNQTSYPGNPTGDWVQYLRDVLLALGPGGCDGFAVHTYTHGTSPDLIDSDRKMDPPFQNRFYHFKAYQDFLGGVPANMRLLPAYVTETDEDDPWADVNSGWVQRAYAQINAWNQRAGTQKLRALILYRWPRLDRWHIEGKGGVIDDLRASFGPGYTWPGSGAAPGPGPTPPPRETPPPTPSPPPTPLPPAVGGPWRPGSTLATAARVNLRRSPGHVNKPAGDVLALVPQGGSLTLLAGGPRRANGLVWWPVRTQVPGGGTLEGWMAERGADGARFLVQTAAAPPFASGDTVRNVSGHGVNLRRSPGYRGKPADDVLAVVAPAGDMSVTGEPRSADGLTWWPVRYAPPGREHSGWIAQTGPTGETFLADTDFLAR
jgi:hypothetical protein